MLKLTTTFFLFFLFPLLVFSQENKNQEFIGSILLADDTMISYKLTFQDVGNGQIKGKSITDFAGEHRTISSVEGKIDYGNNLISYRETKNLLTKSNYNEESFCYIHLTNAKINFRNRKSIIEGRFQGKFPNGEPCVAGELKLVGSDFFFKKMDKFNKRISRINKIDSLSKAKLATSIFKESVVNTTLEKEEAIALYVPDANFIFLELWDEELEDGDRIDVFVDDQLVLEDYEIKNQKKTLKLAFNKQQLRITIVANNIGLKAPNTVSLNVKAHQQVHKLRTKLEQDDQAYLLLQKN